MATLKKSFFDDDDNVALRLTKKLPKKARGFKKQLATMYLDKDPVKRIVASILHSAHLHDTNCFILSKRLLEDLVENDPNLGGSNIRMQYIAVCGLLNRKFAQFIKLNKAASVWFLHPEILEILQISGTSFQPGCKKYIQKKGISDFENWRKFKQLRLKDEEDKNQLISADSQEVLDAKIETLRDMYGPEIASWEQYLLDMPENERFNLLERAKLGATNAH